MLQSLSIRLETEEDDILIETMRRYNEACNFAAERAFVLKLRNKYKLHKIVYKEIRERFGLSSQLAIRIISKVVESYKYNKKPWFKPLGAIQYDQRNSRISIDKVSIMTLQGRLKLVTTSWPRYTNRWFFPRTSLQLGITTELQEQHLALILYLNTNIRLLHKTRL